MTDLDRCLPFVLEWEGGYSDHPSDPGGATNLGITHAVLAEWRGKPVTKADVKALALPEAAQIYRARYWDKVRGDSLPAGIDLAVFDCAVNQGVGRAIRLLQEAARVKVDGVIGPRTLEAIQSAAPIPLLNEFMARRMNAYGLLVNLFRSFGLGWSRRLMSQHTEALRMILMA